MAAAVSGLGRGVIEIHGSLFWLSFSFWLRVILCSWGIFFFLVYTFSFLLSLPSPFRPLPLTAKLDREPFSMPRTWRHLFSMNAQLRARIIHICMLPFLCVFLFFLRVRSDFGGALSTIISDSGWDKRKWGGGGAERTSLIRFSHSFFYLFMTTGSVINRHQLGRPALASLWFRLSFSLALALALCVL